MLVVMMPIVSFLVGLSTMEHRVLARPEGREAIRDCKVILEAVAESCALNAFGRESVENVCVKRPLALVVRPRQSEQWLPSACARLKLGIEGLALRSASIGTARWHRQAKQRC